MATTRDPITLELYVRTLSPRGAQASQEATIDRLHRLEAEGVVDGTSVQVWGRRIDPMTSAAETDKGEFILNRIAEFQGWALANNATLESFHETRDRSSSITGEEHTTIVLPQMGLAEYRGNELEQVSPCTIGEEVYTVPDHLEEIERQVGPGAAARERAAAPVAEE